MYMFIILKTIVVAVSLKENDQTNLVQCLLKINDFSTCVEDLLYMYCTDSKHSMLPYDFTGFGKPTV